MNALRDRDWRVGVRPDASRRRSLLIRCIEGFERMPRPDGYLIKPLEAEVFLEELRAVLQQ
jgi:hypothetical protein